MILFSYGSGLAATMFSLRLNEGQHPFSLSNIATVMNVSEKLKSRHEVYLLILVLFLDLIVDSYLFHLNFILELMLPN